MSDTSNRLPRNVQKWEAAMAKVGLTGQTIHGAELASASKMEYKQFLLLRVLWVPHNPDDLPKLLPDINNWISKAGIMLEDYKSWNTYCHGFTHPDIEEGSFAIARHYQLEVTKTANETDPQTLDTPIAHRTRARVKELSREFEDMYLKTPSKSTNISRPLDIESMEPDDSFLTSETPSPYRAITPAPKDLVNVMYPPTKDEQIVNCALVIFLNALTVHFKLANNWTLHRKAFKAIFEEASFEARTDGYLDYRGHAQAIIEVKPVTRSKDQDLIQIQESAQMVAWIKSDKEKPNGAKKVRLHVAQDRHEIFLTAAEYDDDYHKYLEDKNHHAEPPSFMTMHQFGPWDIRDPVSMKYLGPILLAITLRAEAKALQG